MHNTVTIEDIAIFNSIIEDALIIEDIAIFNAIKKYNLASIGSSAIINIAERLNIKTELDYYLKDNKTNLEQEGSNFSTLICFLNCYEAAVHERLTVKETTNLLISSLFINFNNMKEFSNEINIKESLNGLNSCYDDKEDICKNIIKTAKNLSITPSNIMQKIIRDDILIQFYNYKCINDFPLIPSTDFKWNTFWAINKSKAIQRNFEYFY